MPRMRITVLIALAGALLAAPGAYGDEEEAAARERKALRPSVEVVFVLDTTGSMSSLIEGAKTKIWKIVNQVVSGEPVPVVRVGLVAYRDRRDTYVTKITGLTDDLDQVYGVLRGFSANGGGDEPESVNEALHKAVKEIAWTPGPTTLRIIYLVGDAPPHMDYGNDIKYPVTCEAAARAGIIINAIQCGTNPRTLPIWQDIARKAEGKYVQISQGGGMLAMSSPFDERLSELDAKLSLLAVFYGTRAEQSEAERYLEAADDALKDAAPEAKAERAGYRSKSGRVSSRDLLSMLENKEIELGKVDVKLLPEALRKMSEKDWRKHIAKLLDLDKKRGEHVKAELAKKGGKGDAFDEKVLEALKEQAGKVGIKYR